jgi:hypothetical protein
MVVVVVLAIERRLIACGWMSGLRLPAIVRTITMALFIFPD